MIWVLRNCLRNSQAEKREDMHCRLRPTMQRYENRRDQVLAGVGGCCRQVGVVGRAWKHSWEVEGNEPMF